MMVKRAMFYLIGAVLTLMGCADKPVFRVKQGQMILRLDQRWTSAECDSILRQYDLTCIQRSLLFDQLNTGECANEGWIARRSGRHFVEVYKDARRGAGQQGNSEYMRWMDTDINDSVQTSLNNFSNDVAGFNSTKKRCFEMISDSVTRFYLNGFTNAQSVILSGSFNNWSVSACRMKKADGRWYYDLILPYGRHEYKFIIDGVWYQDSDNLIKAYDNADGYNSVYFRTNRQFKLKGCDGAKRVVLAGSFNDWDEYNWKLLPSDKDWTLDVFLPDGTHFYKFICDGIWIVDPNNSDLIKDGEGNLNSRLIIGKTTRFYLPGYTTASAVYLVGSFNNFANGSALMERDTQGWFIDYALRPGNYLFHFIADGKPILLRDGSWPIAGDYNLLIVGANHSFTFSDPQSKAREVAVSGDFIQWAPAGIPMQRTAEGYQVDVFLPRGKNRYKFIVDGQWILDPANSAFEDNEYRTGNSILWK
jgi:hypothetical protein